MNSSDAFLRVLYNLVKNDKLNGGLLFKKADIVSKIPEIINRKKIVIGIAGESASGKTTFINTMRDNFRCTVLSCDDYYRDTSKELREAGSFEALFKTGINFDIPDAYDLEFMKSHISKLKSGKSISSPVYNFATCEQILDMQPKEPHDIIFIEGLFALDSTFSDILDLKIYVDTDAEVIKERWYKRAKSRGKTDADAKIQFATVKKEALRHIVPKKETADIVISGSATVEYINSLFADVYREIDAPEKSPVENRRYQTAI
ncbi:MAG TPA: hypothetical protein H9673_06435 [Candidatus Adamsella sp.]|nr:hypothetical protein [Candidatus Adamsella sp.]